MSAKSKIDKAREKQTRAEGRAAELRSLVQAAFREGWSKAVEATGREINVFDRETVTHAWKNCRTHQRLAAMKERR